MRILLDKFVERYIASKQDDYPICVDSMNSIIRASMKLVTRKPTMDEDVADKVLKPALQRMFVVVPSACVPLAPCVLDNR